MTLSVIIVNYNVKVWLEQCLHAVTRASVGIRMEIIVVDNHSSDGSREYLEPLFPDVLFMWQPANTGFASACNQGLSRASGTYILFLNPDTLLPEDCFTKLIAFFEEHPEAGAVGVRMLDGQGRFLKESKRGYPTTMASFFKLSGLTALFPHSRFFAHYYLGHLQEDCLQIVDVLSGAFMALPATVVKRLGGFDEAFFMYGEDIDLSYRVSQLGLKNYYYPAITIIHFKGESTKKETVAYIRNFYMAMEIFVRKYHTRFVALLYSGCIRAIIAIKTVLLKMRGSNVKKRKGSQRHTNKSVIVAGDMIDAGVLDLWRQFDDNLDFSEFSYIKELHSPVNHQLFSAATDILFCVGALSMKEVIAALKTYQLNGPIAYHYVGSKSIVTASAD